jgi:hypothetical protein
MHNNPSKWNVVDTRDPATMFKSDSPRVQTTTSNWLDRRSASSGGRVPSQDAVYGHKLNGNRPITLADIRNKFNNSSLVRATLHGYPLDAQGKVIGPAYGAAAHRMKNVGDVKKPTDTVYFTPDVDNASAYLMNAPPREPGIWQKNNTFLNVFSPSQVRAEKPIASSLGRERLTGGYLEEMHGGQPIGARPAGVYKPLNGITQCGLYAEYVPAGFNADSVVNKALRRAGLSTLTKTPTPTPVALDKSYQPTFDEASQRGILPQHWNKVRTNPEALSLFEALRDASSETQRKQLLRFAKEGLRRQNTYANQMDMYREANGWKDPGILGRIAARIGTFGDPVGRLFPDITPAAIKQRGETWTPALLAKTLARYSH